MHFFSTATSLIICCSVLIGGEITYVGKDFRKMTRPPNFKFDLEASEQEQALTRGKGENKPGLILVPTSGPVNLYSISHSPLRK